MADKAEPILRCELLRWLAMDAIGGGWFSEYDVINYGPPNHPVRKYRSSRAHYGLALVYLTRTTCQEIVRRLLDGADQSLAFAGANVYIDCWPDIHREYNEFGWDVAETVHFSTRSVEDAGIVVPKHRLIDNCGRAF